jgi:hypothetical protein
MSKDIDEVLSAPTDVNIDPLLAQLIVPKQMKLNNSLFMSYKLKIGPDANRIAQYNMFVKAVVCLHIAIGCNVTPKVHLMQKHVAKKVLFQGD